MPQENEIEIHFTHNYKFLNFVNLNFVKLSMMGKAELH